MNLSKKVARLKGFAEGLDISSGSKNGKIIKGILDILDDMADCIEDLSDKTDTLDDYITEIDEDLGMLEEEYEQTCGHKLYKKSAAADLDDDDYEEDDDDDFDDDEEEEDDDDEVKESAENEILDGVVELKCPHCKEHILIETDDILDSEDMIIECPECEMEIEIINEESGGRPCFGCAARCENSGDVDEDDDEDEEDDDDEDDEVLEF